MGFPQEYKRSLKAIEVEEIFDLIFYRPLAFLFVKLIASTSITPNQLTLFSMILGLFGGASYAFGTPTAYVAGGVLLLLYNIIDCADGQLARLKKSGTPLGRILDGIADYVVSITAYVGIGLGYANGSDNPPALWLLTAVAGLSTALQSSLLDYYRNRFLDRTQDRVSVLDDGLEGFRKEFQFLKAEKGSYLRKAFIGIYLAYSKIQGKVTSSRRTTSVTAETDRTAYYIANRRMIRLWTYLGPTTQWTLLIVCSFFSRLDIYLWGIAAVGNVLAGILSVLQKRVDMRLQHVR